MTSDGHNQLAHDYDDVRLPVSLSALECFAFNVFSLVLCCYKISAKMMALQGIHFYFISMFYWSNICSFCLLMCLFVANISFYCNPFLFRLM